MQHKIDKDEETEKQHRIESFYGRFARSFTLPSDVDESKISARTINGILSVRLPKTRVTETKPVAISVQ
ncbi:MAG: Hsp20/alpha crystallin family protein [Woeseia sp.]